jgi:propionate CoA-transferase
VGEGRLQILAEGSIRKFVDCVDQVTFSGGYAWETGQAVLYITERAVFSLGKEGLTLCEAAPGVDLERDIFAHMDFRPRLAVNFHWMDQRIFS